MTILYIYLSSENLNGKDYTVMEHFLALMPKGLINTFKWLRKLMLYMLNPIDYFYRVINGKGDFPSLILRRYVGPLRNFEASGSEFNVYLKLLGKLRSDERILDIGCGCGLMVLYLRDYLFGTGKYMGVDIYKPAISWAQKNLQNDRFTFKHIDVKNNIYNPSGKYNVKDFIFPYENGSFDFILLKSVFTHMNAEDINSYLAEINRLLSQHGRALITLFLLDAEQTKLADQGRNALKFSFGDDNCKWVYKNRPESAIAYSTDTVFEMVKRNKLTVKEPIYYGTWSGREDGVSFQDLIVIQKDSNGVT